MQTSKQALSGHTRKQRGAALFMALIFLLVLTVLGVFGMNLSRLENLMAGNTQYQTQALNNAEYVLIAAEADLKSLSTDMFRTGDVAGDYYYPHNDAQTPPQTLIDFDSNTTGTQQATDLVWAFSHADVTLPDLNGDGLDTDGDTVADDGTGMYVIQDAGDDNDKGSEHSVSTTVMGKGAPGAIVQVFLVTAQSGAARGAKRILQSVVVTDPL